MKFKKLISAVAASAMAAAMLTAPALAEGNTLTYGVDYTCAAYFNNASLVTGDDAKALTIGSTVFNRSSGGTTTTDGQGSGRYYVVYAVMDISNIDIESVTVGVTAADANNTGYKLFYTTTDESVAAKAPGEVAKSGDTDFCGNSDNYYNDRFTI